MSTRIQPRTNKSVVKSDSAPKVEEEAPVEVATDVEDYLGDETEAGDVTEVASADADDQEDTEEETETVDPEAAFMAVLDAVLEVDTANTGVLPDVEVARIGAALKPLRGNRRMTAYASWITALLAKDPTIMAEKHQVITSINAIIANPPTSGSEASTPEHILLAYKLHIAREALGKLTEGVEKSLVDQAEEYLKGDTFALPETLKGRIDKVFQAISVGTSRKGRAPGSKGTAAVDRFDLTGALIAYVTENKDSNMTRLSVKKALKEAHEAEGMSTGGALDNRIRSIAQATSNGGEGAKGQTLRAYEAGVRADTNDKVWYED